MIYKNTGSGLSLYELLCQPRVIKIMIISALTFIKYNNIMQFIYIYTLDNKDNIDFLLSTMNFTNSFIAHIGQFIIGIICYKFFRGRIIQLFVWVLAINFVVDILVMLSLII